MATLERRGAERWGRFSGDGPIVDGLKGVHEIRRDRFDLKKKIAMTGRLYCHFFEAFFFSFGCLFLKLNESNYRPKDSSKIRFYIGEVSIQIFVSLFGCFLKWWCPQNTPK